jgi:hypothetical protein
VPPEDSSPNFLTASVDIDLLGTSFPRSANPEQSTDTPHPPLHHPHSLSLPIFPTSSFPRDSPVLFHSTDGKEKKNTFSNKNGSITETASLPSIIVEESKHLSLTKVNDEFSAEKAQSTEKVKEMSVKTDSTEKSEALSSEKLEKVTSSGFERIQKKWFVLFCFLLRIT